MEIERKTRMGIVIEDGVFHIQTKNSSYIMMVNPAGYLCHVFYGKRIGRCTLKNRELGSEKNPDMLPLECGVYGSGDFRIPAVEVRQESGSMVSELFFESYVIEKGKPALTGLPQTYSKDGNGVETLIQILSDHATGLQVRLYYTVFEEYDMIVRRAEYVNTGVKNDVLVLERALSFSLDFMDSGYKMLQLSGAWARERIRYDSVLTPGIHEIDSKRGISSAVQNPFLALIREDTTEDAGEAYGFNLVYSGNFLGCAEVDSNHRLRIAMGINPFEFEWYLNKGQMFETPEAVLTYSDNGLGGMSRHFHRFYRDCLCRGTYQYKERPILLNNWEATYFSFTEGKIYEIASMAAYLGVELFVLDDGWFGHRDLDNSSLGDWVTDYRKLPNGLLALSDKINSLGMKFGLWFEPEMVSEDSDLYRKHPDWCIHVPERKPKASSYVRNQMVLDLTRKEVCEYIIDAVSNILSSAKISYVKWDMNRSMTDIGSANRPAKYQKEFFHRYMLGLYRILETITGRFPEVLFESCCSGGGRFDPGMLYYMPQTWTSDDTDAIERLKIQYGTSLVYPPITMGCHVSAVPNHQVGRRESLKMRGDVAMCGNFGYELDATKLTDEEKEEVKQQIKEYKRIRKIIQFGEMYRLISPYDGEQNESAYCYISGDGKDAVVFYYRILAKPNLPPSRLKLKGLIKEKVYEVEGTDIKAYGDELMQIGMELVNEYEDFKSKRYLLKQIEE